MKPDEEVSTKTTAASGTGCCWAAWGAALLLVAPNIAERTANSAIVESSPPALSAREGVSGAARELVPKRHSAIMQLKSTLEIIVIGRE